MAQNAMYTARIVTMTTAFTTASCNTRVERRWIFFADSGFTSS